MKSLFTIAVLTLGLSTAIVHAQRAPDPRAASGDRIDAHAGASKPLAHSTTPNETELLSHGHYKARNGHEVHSPAKSVRGAIPAGASAQCGDSTYSFSQHRRGTCSHHGGVVAWL